MPSDPIWVIRVGSRLSAFGGIADLTLRNKVAKGQLRKSRPLPHECGLRYLNMRRSRWELVQDIKVTTGQLGLSIGQARTTSAIWGNWCNYVSGFAVPH